MVYRSCYENNKSNFIYQSDDCPKPQENKCCQINDEQGGDPDIFSPGWIETYIKQPGHPLGNVYPRKGSAWSEGQSPSFLFLVNNGLSDPDSIAWGCWGGRFERNKKWGTDARSDEILLREVDFSKDYCMYVPARDWAYTPRENKYTFNRLAPVFRWREPMSWDFKARMDWAVKGVELSNHNPVIRFKNIESEKTLFLDVTAGDTIVLNASDSFDPDGDKINFIWWIYKEPGKYNGQQDLDKQLSKPWSAITKFSIPDDSKCGDKVHIILEVTDAGIPQLKSYRRILLNVK